MNDKHVSRPLKIGVNVWGAVAALLSLAIVVFLVIAAFHMSEGTLPATVPKWISSTYHVLKDQGTLVGAIVGFSALAWAHFFQALTKN